MKPTTQFMAIYRWRVDPENHERFCHAWRRLTEGIYAVRGSHGSRLTRDESGAYVAIALWPTREAWAATLPAIPDEVELLAALRGSVVETYPTLLLDVVDDLWALPTD